MNTIYTIEISVCVTLQESFYSYALKSLITISTVILLCLIVAYHWLLVQVNLIIIIIIIIKHI